MSINLSYICEIFPVILKNILDSDKSCSPKLKAIEKIDMIRFFKKHPQEIFHALFYMIVKNDNGISFYDYLNELGEQINNILELEPTDDREEISKENIIDILSKVLGVNYANDFPKTNSNNNLPKTGILYDQSKEIEDLQKENETLKNLNNQLQNS